MIRPLSGALRNKRENPPGTRQRELRRRGAAGAEQNPAHPRCTRDHRGGRRHAWRLASQEECRRRRVQAVVRARQGRAFPRSPQGWLLFVFALSSRIASQDHSPLRHGVLWSWPHALLTEAVWIICVHGLYPPKEPTLHGNRLFSASGPLVG